MLHLCPNEKTQANLIVIINKTDLPVSVIKNLVNNSNKQLPCVQQWWNYTSVHTVRNTISK